MQEQKATFSCKLPSMTSQSSGLLFLSVHDTEQRAGVMRCPTARHLYRVSPEIEFPLFTSWRTPCACGRSPSARVFCRSPRLEVLLATSCNIFARVAYRMRIRVGDTSIISSSPMYVTTSSSDMVRIGERRMFSSCQAKQKKKKLDRDERRQESKLLDDAPSQQHACW